MMMKKTTLLALALFACAARAQVDDLAGDARVASLLRAAAANGCEVTHVISTQGCCRVQYVLRPTAESYVRCQLALPQARAWSGRFWGFGNGGGGGWVGVDLRVAERGDVAVHTDLGTTRGVWGKREVLTDFGWRATHLMTVSAKELTKAFFGREPDKCYFKGGSTGGGQGFHEALRFPGDYDGILAYVPAFSRLPLHVYFAWCDRCLKREDGTPAFAEAELQAVEQAAIDWFADKDEPAARGKYLTDTRYTPEAEQGILELAAARQPSLRTGDKLVRLHRLFYGPVLAGEHVHSGVPFSADIRRSTDNGWLLEWYLGPGRSTLSATDEELLAWMREWGPVCNADGEGFARYAARGGKLIVIGGLEDSIVPYPAMIDWYERATRECAALDGGLRSACRLYLLPGRAHGQGRGCGDVNGDEALLVDWVEKGVAPETVTSDLRGGGTLAVRPYPECWAR